MDRKSYYEQSAIDHYKEAERVRGGTELSSEELIEQVLKAKTCKVAMERVCLATYKFVAKLAFNYNRVATGISMDDKISAGMVGVHNAVRGYDPEQLNEDGKPFSFLTYAGHWIYQAMQRELDNYSDTVRLPCHLHRANQNIYRNYLKYCQENDIEKPKRVEDLDHEFAYSLMTDSLKNNIKPNNIKDLQVWLSRLKMYENLEASVSNDTDNDITLAESIDLEASKRSDDFDNPEILVEAASQHIDIYDSIKMLPMRVRLILIMRFSLGSMPEYTLEEVGQIFGLTRERVRQIEGKTFRILRDWLRKGKPYDLANNSAFSRERQLEFKAEFFAEHFTMEQIEEFMTPSEYQQFLDDVSSLNKSIAS